MQMSETEQQEVVNQIYDYAANLLINENYTSYEAKEALIEQGLDQETAAIVIDKLEKDIGEVKQKGANKDMIYGALWCIGGIVVTAASYSAASGGGTYVVTWGAILFGAVQFFKGLVNSAS
ncbi:MAG TPA: hypothetical protein DCS93_20845 [Microscillaceae bacterium]|nr:hypothetical protein [Microscillaceae bacterium]